MKEKYKTKPKKLFGVYVGYDKEWEQNVGIDKAIAVFGRWSDEHITMKQIRKLQAGKGLYVCDTVYIK